MLASAGSLALHVGVVVLAVALVGRRAAQRSPGPHATDIEVVAAAARPPAPPRPVPPPPPGHAMPAPRPAGGVPSAGARTRRDPVQRTPPSPPATLRSLADLTISDRDPNSFTDPAAPARVDAASGLGHAGLGAGVDFRRGDGVATMDIAQPATASLARPVRPRHDYSNSRIVGASRFAGETIKLRLHIDARGRVHAVDLLQGVDRDLDRKTLALVHGFEYEPALDDSGAPVPVTLTWTFQIVEDEDGATFDAAREKIHR
jgi:hypothetical protein